jgi:hypothetical protein
VDNEPAPDSGRVKNEAGFGLLGRFAGACSLEDRGRSPDDDYRENPKEALSPAR